MSNAIYNIDINPNILRGTISELQKDNENIKDIINVIYENVNKIIDDNVWKSPEKKFLMDELIPYIEKSNSSIYNELNNCVTVLNTALNKYLERNYIIEKNANNLADVDVIEELL